VLPQQRRDRGRGAAAAALREGAGGRIAVLDVDAHHGNGTQTMFYADPGVLTGSVHVDPAHGWFPHFAGFAGERGRGDGAGANLNLPLAPGSGDGPWLEAVEQLAAWAADGEAQALVVALGVDAAAADPESPLDVTAAGYAAAGRALGGLGLPAVIVQEGGYDLDAIGELVAAFLGGFERGDE
jgi:acetoin utilization deacetylase AcuC-like enzyme